MTIMHIQIPDDLKEAFENAFPGETIEQAFERLLRAELARRPMPRSPGSQSLVEAFKELSKNFPPMSHEELRRLRQEGRP